MIFMTALELIEVVFIFPNENYFFIYSFKNLRKVTYNLV